MVLNTRRMPVSRYDIDGYVSHTTNAVAHGEFRWEHQVCNTVCTLARGYVATVTHAGIRLCGQPTTKLCAAHATRQPAETTRRSAGQTWLKHTLGLTPQHGIDGDVHCPANVAASRGPMGPPGAGASKAAGQARKWESRSLCRGAWAHSKASTIWP